LAYSPGFSGAFLTGKAFFNEEFVMGTRSETAQQSFSCSADRVYAALIEVLGKEKMTIKFQDVRQRQVFAGTGWSAFSWGEEIIIQIHENDAQHTDVVIESKPIMKINFTAAPRNKRNIARIFAGLEARLA